MRSDRKSEYLRKVPFLLATLLAVALLSSCGSSSSGSGSDDDADPDDEAALPFTELDGTWRGNLEDPLGTMHTLEISVSGKKITSVVLDGVDQGVTGRLGQSSKNVFGFSLSDSTKGGFIVDKIRQHLTCVDDNFNVGVLQKDAGILPPFVQADLAVSGNGTVVITDLVTFQELNSNITCDAVGACTGADDQVGNFTATMTYTNLGRWTGTKTFATGMATTSILLSEDKQFAGSWACTDVNVFPGTCSFTSWSL